MISSRFLLTGARSSLITDAVVKISAKNLAVDCLSAIIHLHPKCFLLDLFLDEDNEIGRQSSNQQLWDVVLFSSHSDPQLRGNVSLLISSFISRILSANTPFNDYLMSNCSVASFADAPSLEDLVQKMFKIASPEERQSVAIRSGMKAFQNCMISLIKSNEMVNRVTIEGLKKIMTFASHSYWLIKVELLSLISAIPFRDLLYLESSLALEDKKWQISIQEELFTQAFPKLLSDDDPRVRNAAASTLMKIVPHLFTSSTSLDGDPITCIAQEYTRRNLGRLSSPKNNLSYVPLMSTQLLFPSDILPDSFDFIHPFVSSSRPHLMQHGIICDDFEENLLYVVVFLQDFIMSNVENKKALMGGLVSLEQLSHAYSPPKHPIGWRCITLEDAHSSIPFLRFLMSLLTSSNPIVLDLTVHQKALSLMGQVLSGFGYHLVKAGVLNGLNLSDIETKEWGLLETRSRELSLLLDFLTTHILRLLHLYHCLMEEGTQAKSSSGLSSFLSPIRRKRSNLGENEKAAERKQHPFEVMDQNSVKMLDVLRANFSTYKSCMELGPPRFKTFLESVLRSLSQVMEMSTLKYFGPKIEVILEYLKSLMLLSPVESVICIQQLLKCIFGTNFALLMVPEAIIPDPETGGYVCRAKKNLMAGCDFINSESISQKTGLYQTCISIPYREFANSQGSKAIMGSSSAPSGYNISWNEEISLFKMMVGKNFDKRVAGLLDKVSLAGPGGQSFASHIKSFEPLVIRSLKMYVTSSDTELQAQVLSLLSLLVKLRVNYCLLDPDQAFLGFVLKQFEFIEAGQIIRPERIVDRIFNFLLILSYERFDSNLIMTVPKIIQLSDGLLASGEPPEQYAISAALHLVEDLFIHRNPSKSDTPKELDTQREVIISTLLKVACYPKSIELMMIVIQQSRRDGDEKWKKVSRLIIDILLPLLTGQQLIIDDIQSFESLLTLLESSSPAAFRPVDILLKALFACPRDDILQNPVTFQRWMVLIIVTMKVIMVYSKEDTMLTRLEEMMSKMLIGPHGLPVLDSDFYPQSIKSPVLNQDDNGTEDFMSQFMLQVLELFVYQLAKFNSDIECQAYRTFTSQMLSQYLLLLTHMFQSGAMRRSAKSASQAVKNQRGSFDVTSVNLLFEEIELSNPTLVIQWCNILMLLGFDDNETHEFWYKLIGRCSQSTVTTPMRGDEPMANKDFLNASFPSAHLEMIRRGTIILLCDFSCENTSDAEQMTWLIVNQVREIIKWSYELPVKDLINSVHRNSASSALFIQAINSRCLGFDSPTFVRKVLNCLEFIHPTQSGPLVVLLAEHIITNPQLRHFSSLTTAAEKMAIQRLQMILKSDDVEEITSQLSLEDIKKLVASVDRFYNHELYGVLLIFMDELRPVERAEEAYYEPDTTILKDEQKEMPDSVQEGRTLNGDQSLEPL